MWRNRFTGENFEQTEAQANERSKFDKRLGGLRGTGGRGVPRYNVRRFRYGRPSWFGQKNIQNLGFLLFVSYDLMNCDVFTQLAVNNKLQFFVLFYHIICNLSITFLWNYLQLQHFAACLAASWFWQNCPENTPTEGAINSPNGVCGKAPRKFL